MILAEGMPGTAEATGTAAADRITSIIRTSGGIKAVIGSRGGNRAAGAAAGTEGDINHRVAETTSTDL